MKSFIVAALFGLAGAHAQAAVIPAQSTLGFQFKQMNVPVDGVFKRFDTVLKFDPKQPQAGSVSVKVDLTSVDTGGQDANDELKRPAWFDSTRVPTAEFQAKSFTPAGPNRYVAKGELTLKGKKQPITLPFTVTPAGNGRLWLDGKTEIKRLTYGIGTGEWADVGVVADAVQIKFRLLYQP